jgi:hypothetical protein
MRAYSVVCFTATTGRVLWSVTQEAECPAWAIARACLPPHERERFVVVHDEAPDELVTPHPAADMGTWAIVRAEAIT